jgi:hypothetical protein
MKNKIILPLIILALAVVSFPSCSDFVESVNPLINQVEDVRLNDASQAQFLLRGVKGEFWRAHNDENPGTELLGDVCVFDDRVHQSVFTQGEDQTEGAYVPRSNEDKYSAFHELRFEAHEMLRRLPLMLETGTIATQLEEDMRFWAHFLAGYAYMQSATWFGLDINGGSPGSVISPDPTTGDELGIFRPTTDIFGFAIDEFNEALKYTPSSGDGMVDGAYAKRVVNSFMARVHIFNHTGAYNTSPGSKPAYVSATAATAAADAGLTSSDPPFVLQFGEGFTNRTWDTVGRGSNHQYNIDSRFARYILADPKEGEIVNDFRADDEAVTTNFAAADVWNHGGAVGVDDPKFPVYDLGGGFSLATRPASGAVNVHGDPVPAGNRFEGEPGNRGNFDADNPRGDEATRLGLTGDQTARIQLVEMYTGTGFVDAYREDDGYAYGSGIQTRPDQLAAAYGADKYNLRGQEIVLIDWQEMNLIKAEVLLGTNDQAALDLINENRASHNLDDITMAEMQAFNQPWSGAYDITGPLGLLIVERDKELLLRSTRMYDQFRFGIFHLPLGTDWPYFPIPQSEIDINPNVTGTLR